MDLYNILVLGEVGVGKSDFLNAFMNPDHVVNTSSEETPGFNYWRPLPPSVSGRRTWFNLDRPRSTAKDANVRFEEIPGSKGRSPNTHDIILAAKTGFKIHSFITFPFPFLLPSFLPLQPLTFPLPFPLQPLTFSSFLSFSKLHLFLLFGN